MDTLRLVDILIGIAFAGAGWWMNNVWSAIKDLQVTDKDLAEKVSKLEVFVATNYLSTERFEVVMATQSRVLDKISDRLDKLSDKIDAKMDKQ